MLNAIDQFNLDSTCEIHISCLKKCEGWLEDSYTPQIMPENFLTVFNVINNIKANDQGHYTEEQVENIKAAQIKLAYLVQADINSFFKTAIRNRGLESVYGLISVELNNNRFEYQPTIRNPENATQRIARFLSPYLGGEGYAIRDVNVRRASVPARTSTKNNDPTL